MSSESKFGRFVYVRGRLYTKATQQQSNAAAATHATMMMYSVASLEEEDLLPLFSDVGAAVGRGDGSGDGLGLMDGAAVDGTGVVGAGLTDGAGDGGMKVVGAQVGGPDGNSVGDRDGCGVTVGALVG